MVRNLNKSETSLLIPIPIQTVKTPKHMKYLSKIKCTKFKSPFNFSNIGCKISFKLF